jgi:hypothetical protein
MKSRFKSKSKQAEVLKRQNYDEFTSGRPDALCAVCNLTDPGEACESCGLPVPLPSSNGL